MRCAAFEPICLRQGREDRVRFRRQDADGAADPVAGLTFSIRVARNRFQPALINITNVELIAEENGQPVGNVFDVIFTAAHTAMLAPGEYAIEVIDTTGAADITLGEGEVTVEPAIGL